MLHVSPGDGLLHGHFHLLAIEGVLQGKHRDTAVTSEQGKVPSGVQPPPGGLRCPRARHTEQADDHGEGPVITGVEPVAKGGGACDHRGGACNRGGGACDPGEQAGLCFHIWVAGGPSPELVSPNAKWG